MSLTQRDLARHAGRAPRVGYPITIDPADWEHPPSATRTLRVSWHPGSINDALRFWLNEGGSAVRGWQHRQAIDVAIDALRACGADAEGDDEPPF